MKIRMGFVSNSSSSSFIISKSDLKPENFVGFEYKKYNGNTLKITNDRIYKWIKKNYDKIIKVNDLKANIILDVFSDFPILFKIFRDYLKEKGMNNIDWDKKGKILEQIILYELYNNSLYLKEFLETCENEVLFLLKLNDFRKIYGKFVNNFYIFEDIDEMIENKIKIDSKLMYFTGFFNWFDKYIGDNHKLCDIDCNIIVDKLQLLTSKLEYDVENIDKIKVVEYFKEYVFDIGDYAGNMLKILDEFDDNEELYVFEVYGNGDGWQDDVGSPMYEVGKDKWDKFKKVISYY